MTLLMLTLACGEKPVEPTPLANGQDDSVLPPPPLIEEAPGRYLATWVSPSCGERTYPRHITFTPDFRFTSEDLVSPCPPDVVCVWSGIVMRNGSWSSQGRALVLSEEGEARNGSMGAPLPPDLAWNQDGRLVEMGPDNEQCAYEKAGSDDEQLKTPLE